MIYTVTFNPSIDYVINVENFRPGAVNRVVSENKYPGGKGINVSRVLNNLGIKNKALGFIGGFTGQFIKNSLESEGVDTDFIELNGDTRINVKLKSNDETEINGSGPNVDEENLNKLFEKINSLNSEDFLVLAGNVQNSLPRNIYSIIQEKCLDKKIKIVVDTTGEALTSTLRYRPFLIKPNNHELGEIFNVEISTREEIIHYAQKLRELGADNVVISMAGEGALLICKEGIYHASAPKGTVKNSVGAGDSLIAGFIARYSQTSDVIESLKWGATAGSATAFSMDLCKKEDVENLLPQVNISKL
ncbi:1-phosphofructokinase [Clostridium magnum]|uniref:Tagatose-6-phosphate kinase n=1 Tax=Clostridium magnum DSM 2767 TaxID=1121326 RepID=A0A161XA07_9CLOT|nr:1-phosphofructokinase [Clostridium magnum]KZL91096.1 tagatose-6-phosphate kinase [Clostridium magnum DSM 2767]SHI18328.1 fructose-1-phosphate kinase [Clostridium magnum DSM 2767]